MTAVAYNDTSLEPSWLHGPDILPVSSPESRRSAEDEETKSILSPNIEKAVGKTLSGAVPLEVAPDEDDGLIECCGCRHDPVIWAFQVYHLLAALSSLASISANIYVITQNNGLLGDFRDDFIRLYAIIFGAWIVIIETEWSVLMQYFLLFHSWFLRGLWYSLVGIITGNYKSENLSIIHLSL